MPMNLKNMSEINRQVSAQGNLPYDEIKVKYPTLDPAGLQRAGISMLGIKELNSGKALSNSKDRLISAIIIRVALES